MKRIIPLALALLASVAWAVPLTVTVSCTGTGTRPPTLAVSPTVLAFGDVDSGAVMIRTFTVRNSGSGTLTGTIAPTPTCGPDYTLLSNGAPVPVIAYTLTAGQTQTVSVRFAPIRMGAQSCDLHVGP